MKRYIDTYNTIVGFHRYPDAPTFCNYLKFLHRHQFVIRCRFKVTHNEREIEINEQQLKIESYLIEEFGNPCEFGNLSCESIAERILKKFDAHQVTVLEDNYGGATLTREC